MERLVIITPHLSTGGCPQFVLKKIELLKEEFDLHCIEYEYVSPDFVVQRNKIKDILGEKFHSIQEHDLNLIDLLNKLKPSVIWVEEFNEMFMKPEHSKFIFGKHRTWKVIESTHTSRNLTDIKNYLPDKFIFVSKHSEIMYSELKVDSSLIEYPVDIKTKSPLSKDKVGFEDGFHHVINVGLFTPGKNQGYAFEIARELAEHKIKFHFIGNTAMNFKDYWEPILKDIPENCVLHGERDDVDSFLQASDLFLFTSKEELNPLVIKEAMEYESKILMFNLDVYHDSYSSDKNISFLTGNVKEDSDAVLETLMLKDKKKIKAVHLLIDTEDEREVKSIKSMSKLSNKLNYVQHINKRYVGEEWRDIEPKSGWADHGPGHYGAFDSFKKAIKKEFTEDLDAFMIFEADCVLDMDVDVFYKLVLKAIEFCEEHEIEYFSFGDRFVEGLLQSPTIEHFKEFNDFIVTNKIILAHCVLFPGFYREKLLESLDTKPWDSPDIWFNEVIKKKGITRFPAANQEEGMSMIDNIVKNSNYYSSKSREEIIPNILNANKLDGIGVEIGVFKGEFSKHILNNWGGTLYMVDPWRELDDYIDSSNHKNHGSAYSETMESIKGFEDRAIMIRALSSQAVDLFEDESLDFIYIDGNHSYNSVKEDMELWYPKLKKDGLFAGHDYLRLDWSIPPFAENGIDKHIWSNGGSGELNYAGIFGVNPAVEEFCRERNIKFNITNEWTATWLFFK